MADKKTTESILEKYFNNCKNYWLRQETEPCDDKEAFRRALEYDIVEIYHCDGGFLHDPFSPCGEELDQEAVMQFIRYRCMDLYGKDWESHYKEYRL